MQKRKAVPDALGGAGRASYEAPPVDLESLELETDLPSGVASPESWDDFFEAPEGIITCHVRRITPEQWFDPTTGEKVNALGFCGLVPYGVDVELYISEHWGGGTYQVSLLHNHKFAKSRKVAISGPPIMVAKAPPVFVPANPRGAPVNGEEPSEFLREDGEIGTPVSLKGSRNDWEERLTRFAATQQMIRSIAPPDINAALLGVVVSALSKESGGSLKESLENLQMLQELKGDGAPAAGAGWPDLIVKGLDVLPRLAAMQASKSNPRPSASPQLIVADPSPAPAAPRAEASQSPELAEDEPMSASYSDFMDRALDLISTHFGLSPRTDPGAVAAALLLAVPLPQMYRAQVEAQAQAIADLGLASLSDEQLADPAVIAEWRTYVTAVATNYADPARKSPFEGLGS